MKDETRNIKDEEIIAIGKAALEYCAQVRLHVPFLAYFSYSARAIAALKIGARKGIISNRFTCGTEGLLFDGYPVYSEEEIALTS